jgi:hypothetical protein
MGGFTVLRTNPVVPMRPLKRAFRAKGFLPPLYMKPRGHASKRTCLFWAPHEVNKQVLHLMAIFAPHMTSERAMPNKSEGDEDKLTLHRLVETMMSDAQQGKYNKMQNCQEHIKCQEHIIG